MARDVDLTTKRLTFYTTIGTPSLSNTIAYTFPNQMSVSYLDWASWITQYQEHRVLAQKATFLPLMVAYTPSAVYVSVNHAPLSLGINRNAALAAPASIALATVYTHQKLGHSQRKFSITCKAGTAQEMLFMPTSMPGATWNIWMASDAVFTSGTTYGYILLEALVQFRGRF